MAKIYASPSSYVQGKGILLKSKKYIKRLGKRALTLAGPNALKIIGNEYNQYLKDSGFEVQPVTFNGESSMDEIKRIVKIGKDFKADMIIGLGGGKTLDTAKAIANKLKTKVAILPSLASTDAPCSRLSVIYHSDGSFSKYLFYDKNPDLVLVDTTLVAKAPVRFLASGIGDALATNVEAQAVVKHDGNTTLGGKQTLVGNAIAQKCQETLFKYGKEALISVKNGIDSKALDNVIEANILMSGLGFESGGLAAAHAIYNGMTVLHGDISKMMHGEKVAFGTLTQLFLEGVDIKRFDKFLDFELQIGLPTTFKDLRIPNIKDDELLKVAHAANSSNDTMGEMPFEVSDDDIVQAMKAVNAYSIDYQNLK
ncbi:glycerol dehydrogenase [Apilactobacillus micheneri]|uniref:Glycerol dehydrogenase n=1 Tax=Apilactobacillus micheneri TaxID=1899430 RepID=A0A9Q8MTS0_9LACO|nr:glycerol dehydrogenase [Apilactobacillus micheneri]TPR26294.1 glycerol dehydrogenase [Apilactobacillus micheneri]TPR27048.1 glycerol dehydrogenase [Apilactobacillus micheneri]TPR27906.1 glycerol dehydrogenase [Apilactobacillus micheneri]TPR31811.1 glycerol dehydrogenase [Apilactobacillus micheneri]TPR32215.1 glycerol dehydrogenase [Apilactobacillus micheneri]